VLERMDGIHSFCKAGIHYVPGHCLQEWKGLAKALKVCEEGNEITVAEVAMHEGTARAVRDALTKRVNDEALQLLDDVSKGTLNDDQLHVRAERAQELVRQVDLYSSILHEGLEGLKNVAALAQGAAMGAVMQDFAAAGLGV
jgi:ribonuclease HI